MTAAVVRESLTVAWRDLVDGLDRKHLALALGWFVAALGPVVMRDSIAIRGLAGFAYFSIAVAGLNFVMGLGNMSSIGQGAFVATGALVATLLRTRASTGFLVSVTAATVATAAAASVVGAGATRLRMVHLAVSSWLGAWLAALFLASFPSVSGGASGIVVPDATVGTPLGLNWRVTPLGHYLIALTLLATVLVLHRCLARSSQGLLLATIKQNPREAAVIGTLRDAVRLKLFVFGSALAGLAGALGVHLSGIFDHRSFGVLLSVALFLAVLVGGPGRTFAPLLGALVVAALPLEEQPFVGPFSIDSRAGELLAGCLLLGVLHVATMRQVRPPRYARAAAPGEEAADAIDPPRLVVEHLTKSFGGLTAVDDVSLTVDGGGVHGVMGPNGSGKSTLLALVSGHLSPDGGRVCLDEADVTPLRPEERLRLGIGRSLQSTELFPDLSALEHFEAASLVDRRYAGFVRSITRTPRARSEERAARGQALTRLEELGLAGYKDTPAEEISAGARRLLTMGIAAAGRRVVLLDEPSAGMSPAEVLRAAGIILELRRRGAAIVVVEHNMRLLKKIADTITVLDGGRVVARGTPDVIYDDPEVRRAYLGSEKERDG